MALLWVDGFEKYGNAGATAAPSGVLDWKYLEDTYVGNIGVGRDGKCLLVDSTSEYLSTPDLNPQSTTLIFGFAFKLRDVDSDVRLCDLRHPSGDGETVGYSQFTFHVTSVNSANQIQVKRGNTVLATSTTVNVAADTWYYLEGKVECHDTTGTCNVKIDETEVISYSGDTKHRGNTDRYSRIAWNIDHADLLYVDDLYICDSSGSTNNDFLGDCQVATLSPTSDASGNWTPSTGVDLYAVIDEDTLSTDYLKDTTTGNQAIFETTNLTSCEAAGTVVGAMVCCDSQQTSRFNKYPKLITQNGSGGSIQDTGNFMPGNTNPLCYSQIMETDPDGNTWTANTVNTFRVGVEVS